MGDGDISNFVEIYYRNVVIEFPGDCSKQLCEELGLNLASCEGQKKAGSKCDGNRLINLVKIRKEKTETSVKEKGKENEGQYKIPLKFSIR